MTEVTLKAYEDQIDQMIEEARYLEALAHLRHILKRHPRYLDAYYLLGKMFLDAELPELAVDMFQRVLTADPENLLARIGLGLAHDKLKHLPSAVWNLERAYEIDSGNEDLAGEIAGLRAQQSGVMSDHIPLTRAGLAHLYLRGGLYNRAVEELRALLNEDPNRLDLQVALAEAYWRDDQIVQASNLCQQTFDRVPYCLKPNLLLGTLWLNSGQEEGKRYLNRAQEVDPENHLSASLFGTDSLLPEQEITLERLAYEPDASVVDKESAWFKHLESSSVSVGISEAVPEMSDSEMRLVDITASLESQIKIPDWLSDLGITETGVEGIPGEGEEEIAAKELSAWLDATEETEVAQVAAGIESVEETPDWLQELAGEEEIEETLEEIPSWLQEMGSETTLAAGTEEEVPSWLQELEPSEAEETLPEAESTEEVPEWLREMKPAQGEVEEEIPELAAAEEVPEWLREIEPPEAEELTPEGEAEEAEEVPDWLQELGAAGVAAAAPGLAAAEEAPEWFQEIEPPETEELAPEGEAEETEEVPDWLQELGAAGVAAATPELAAAEEVPEWLQEIEPTEAEELAPVSEAEETEEVPDWLQELGTAGIATATPELATAEEIPDWLKKVEPTEAAEMAPEGETEEAEGVPDWLQELGTTGITETEPELVTAEEVPEWLQKVEPTEAAGEEIPVFGWTSFPAAETEKNAPEWLQELPEEAPTVEEEALFGWTSFPSAEAPQVAEAAEEEEVPDWLRELQLPEESTSEEPIVEVAITQPPTEEGGLLSGDDALSWLESLAAGKEDELRAQAEAEAQIRVAEIMGRKPEEPVGVVSEAAAFEETAELEPEPIEEQAAIEVPPLEEVTSVEEPTAPMPEGELLSGDDALSWLQSLTVGKEDELRAQAEAEAQVRVAEIMGRKPEEKPVAEAPVIEGPAGEPTPPETPVAEEEVVPEKVIAAEELVEEEEIIVEELQPTAEELVAEEEIIVEEKPAPLPEEAVEVIPEVSFEAAIEEPAAPIIEKVVQAAPPIKVTRPVVETVSVPTMSTTELEKGRTYIKKHRSDHASRLALARVLWDAGEMEESLDHYSRLIRSNQLMDEVIVDLKRYSEEKPHSPDVLRTLGDSYMKQGLLDKAMEIYRQAMDML